MREVLDTRFFVEHAFSEDATMQSWTRQRVRSLRRRKEGVVPSLVLAEFFDHVCRHAGQREAGRQCDAILESGLAVESLTPQIAVAAGRLRCSRRKVPMADCLIGAMAIALSARVVSDDPHFRELADVRVVWR